MSVNPSIPTELHSPSQQTAQNGRVDLDVSIHRLGAYATIRGIEANESRFDPEWGTKNKHGRVDSLATIRFTSYD